jgi:chaperone modulatory protein CbpM
VTYALVRSRRLAAELPHRLDVETFARASGLHPDMVRRYVSLGLLETVSDAAGHLWFTPAQVATVARIQRLRAGLTLNYAAIGLVLDLLDRIAELEAAARTGPASPRPTGPNRPTGGSPWTRTT